MEHFLTGVAALGNKSPVVATHIGAFDVTNVTHTLARYSQEQATYVRSLGITSYQHKFIEKLLSKQTAIGCLVAPFGYGKTSTAIDVWKECQAHGLLAVPPFSCNSLAEMGQAVATGVIWQLGTDTPAAQQVQAAYNAYLISSARRLAEQDAARYQIDFDTALRSIEDKIERGFINLEATGNYLLIFLEQLTLIVQDAGYSGLLIIVDEFQQFLGNINKAVVTNFRTLVWGLRTRGAVPFGLLITMDPDTERNLAERAGDILHRIKEDGLYLDFSDVYDRDFAPLLWASYARSFGFDQASDTIVDQTTLQAIGQLCERHDLSNGPRTVIDLFQRIARFHPEYRRPYSPIDMIDDFLSGQIRFDGDRSKVASLVNELTGYDYIKRSDARLRLLKLIAAFPRGCSRAMAGKYNLVDAFDQMADALRGEILTELPEGMALIDLQRVGKPQNKLNIILKKYWMQITEDELIADRAPLLFAHHAIDPLFSPSRNVFAGWTREQPDFALMPTGGYRQIYTGTFTEIYPRRRVAIQVCRFPTQIEQIKDYVDISLIFVLHRAQEEHVPVHFDRARRTFQLPIVLDQPFQLPLPRDVRWIEDYLRPVVMTPGVLLTLIEYIGIEAGKLDAITEQELQRIETHRHKLNAFLLAVLFGEDLFSQTGIQIISRGEQAIRDLLFQVLHTSFPNYQTLIRSPQWMTQLKVYSDVIQTLNPLHSRGLEPLREAKAKLAARFGLRNHASFESQAKQYAPLLIVEAWHGNEGMVRFQRHPGEHKLFQTILDQGGSNHDRLIEVARAHGYLPDEVDILLDFLVQRGLIQLDAERDYFTPISTLSIAEINTIAATILAEITELKRLADLPIWTTTTTQLQDILSRSSYDDPMELQTRLLHVQRMMQSARLDVMRHAREQFISRRTTVYKQIEALNTPLPTAQTALPLDVHLAGALRNLITRTQTVTASLRKVAVGIGELISRVLDEKDVHLLEQLSVQSHTWITTFNGTMAQVQELHTLRTQYTAWVHLIEQIGRIYQYIPLTQSAVDVVPIEREVNAVVATLMEGFAIDGLAAFSHLYNTYAPHVNKLEADVALALKAADLVHTASRSTLVHDLPQRSNLAETVLHAVNGNSLTLNELATRCQTSPEALLTLLLELDQRGDLVITIQKMFSATSKTNGDGSFTM